MHRRNSVNINELINRFEVPSTPTEDFRDDLSYLRAAAAGIRMHGGGEDRNKSSLMKYNNNDKYYASGEFRKSNATMVNAFEMAKQFIAGMLLRFSSLLELVSKFPFPRMSVMSFGLTSLLAVFICPRSFTERALYPAFRILFAIIYPAYRSFKAVRNKNLKEYLKWIVYWIGFAFLSCLELLTDATMSWFPFYYEIKVIFMIWLLGPSTRGSMKLYKNCIHPLLIAREQVEQFQLQTM